jgi:hypothetical protein
MFPCEMARYIAGFSPEARKSGASELDWSLIHPESDRIQGDRAIGRPKSQGDGG